MKTLNLQYFERSDIKYNIISFPDGEVQLNIETPLINFKDEIVVKTRITNMNDLFVLLQAADIIERFEIHYYVQIMYLMTQRTDRLFSYGRPLSLKVMMNMLNQMKGHIQILEPHNIDAIKNYSPVGAINYTHQAFTKPENCVYMFPDNGAVERYFTDKIQTKTCYYYFYGEKVRDVNTGEIIDYEVYCSIPESDYIPNKFVVIDDLCDGGRTFITAYDKIKEQFPNATIDLEVVHAVQEGGLRKVCEKFDHVTITNSYARWENLTNECLRNRITNLEVIDVFKLDF